jgi:hypothetical protein
VRPGAPLPPDAFELRPAPRLGKIERRLRELLSDPEALIHTQHDLAVAIYDCENPSKATPAWDASPFGGADGPS